MSRSRISLAIDSGQLTLPEGNVIAIGFRADDDLSAFAKDTTTFVQPFFPDYTALERRGYNVVTAPEGTASVAVVSVPRAKLLAREWIADACRVAPAGLVIVDGQKTDGVESVLKEIKKRVPILGSMSKAHGRLFWFQAVDFSDWAQAMAPNKDSFQTLAGVFSADGIDPASKLLADTLSPKVKGVVADLGAGWGYLSARLLERDSITKVHLIEADKRALDCARQNINDDRAAFHWGDGPTHQLPERVDFVVMNPPFHNDRKADPEIGKRFILAAARLLKPSGQLLLVANRHLPYETILSDRFAHVLEGAGDSRFKTFVASKPRRT
jgi:16S rRNA (guanine1207-N2)-methyltransferase